MKYESFIRTSRKLFSQNTDQIHVGWNRSFHKHISTLSLPSSTPTTGTLQRLTPHCAFSSGFLASSSWTERASTSCRTVNVGPATLWASILREINFTDRKITTLKTLDHSALSILSRSITRSIVCFSQQMRSIYTDFRPTQPGWPTLN